jgi:hypothetical protein
MPVQSRTHARLSAVTCVRQPLALAEGSTCICSPGGIGQSFVKPHSPRKHGRARGGVRAGAARQYHWQEQGEYLHQPETATLGPALLFTLINSALCWNTAGGAE